ncbi:hypothetical protein [Pantoea sp. ACRSB]|nr:hypothetical protein [Pantoea sp. ACRSB]
MEQKAVEFAKWMAEQNIDGADAKAVQMMAYVWLLKAKQVFE